MQNYYISYVYQDGFGCTTMNKIPPVDKPEDIIELANLIAKMIKQPVNSVCINFIKEFAII